MTSISLAIVDDDSLIVSLLNDFLQKQDGIDVCLACESGEDFLAKLAAGEKVPDIIILDLKMKKVNGIEVTEFLKSNYPDISIIVMSSHYKRSFLGFMLKTGVAAFVPKEVSPQQLLLIIKEVSQKGFFFLPDQMEVLREQVSSKAPAPKLIEKNSLSEREIEILKLICHQKTAKEIGEQLFIAPRTVEGHKNNLFIKTGAKNIAGLVIYAIQNNLIDSNDIPLV